ncbi:MAG: hypothetical protein KJ072_05465 [Verrucomicrobia bacterium]|nr:hypothetical protein [Verrucomicrobiota bacterium]
MYRVDPRSMEAVSVFAFADHLGALVYDGPRRALVGVSWGSRRFYFVPEDDVSSVHVYSVE